jgi:hypothetical protein
MLGEHGLALRRFLEATRGALPRGVESKVKACLAETRKAWP